MALSALSAFSINRIAFVGLGLVTSIIGKAGKARFNCEDTKMLRELAEQTRPLLKILANSNLRDEQVKKYLRSVVGALESADEEVGRIKSMSLVSKTVRSSKVASNLRQATTKLIQALSLLGSSSLVVTTKLQDEVDSLKAKIRKMSGHLESLIQWKSEEEGAREKEKKALVVKSNSDDNHSTKKQPHDMLLLEMHYAMVAAPVQTYQTQMQPAMAAPPVQTYQTQMQPAMVAPPVQTYQTQMPQFQPQPPFPPYFFRPF